MAFPLVLIPELIGDVAGLADWGLGLAGVSRENQIRQWLDVVDELGLLNSLAETAFPGATTTQQTAGQQAVSGALNLGAMFMPSGAGKAGVKAVSAIPKWTGKAYRADMWAKPMVQGMVGPGEEPPIGEAAAPPPAQPVPPAGQPAGGQPLGAGDVPAEALGVAGSYGIQDALRQAIAAYPQLWAEAQKVQALRDAESAARLNQLRDQYMQRILNYLPLTGNYPVW